ncbi:1-deoxy-D-xylulose-5-phosphate synthase [Solemya elarraichensis gill symbiont]|uniref:1-deoxy-D-xylulose-5-phosphate synthase n=1 Tax=Solemya elarraichensis gill symbiont TaxID=1918949 RepID=UPI0009989472|nr:1-deoxy-D-xylulose-5-phosphate synthase [Solemya elarraichensis gill symbiont]
MPYSDFSLLETIDTPSDLRRLDDAQLLQVADELRRFLIKSVSETGGHLAAGLGVVELTVALHTIYNTPDDRLVWDVGHQAYPHKILTGRREQMGSLRQKDGIAGFPVRTESPFDTFGTGHSSTSISAAIGMALAARQQGIEREVIAVIGDGALSGGMSFEAMNHGGSIDDLNLTVILNDNDMSISRPVGAVSRYLTRVLSSRFYNEVRDKGRSVFKRLNIGEFADRWEEHMKGMMLPGTLWEELGFTYLGPVDGHDLPMVLSTLRNMKKMRGPRFLHLVTQKGKGYEPAEHEPITYHGVTPFNPSTGKMEKGAGSRSYTAVFGDWVCDSAEQDQRLNVITPAMCEGSGLVTFSERFPERYHDVGIAEQHALTLAAGMACEDVKPVVAIYSTFLQRAYDQLIHDVALQNLDVTFAVDRAGEVGADGATHAGSFDLSYVRAIPNMVVMAPADAREARMMLQTAYEFEGPAMVRYPRGGGPDVTELDGLETLEIGKSEVRRKGSHIALLAFGTMVASAERIAEKLDATVVNMRFVKPVDEDAVREIAASHELLVTLEENVIQGGAGSAVSEYLNRQGIQTDLLQLGLPDSYIEQATQVQQLQEAGLDDDSMLQAIHERISAAHAGLVSAIS